MHLYFLLTKWEKLLHCKSFSHFFKRKYWRISDINIWNFKETLTNDVVSFEQPAPDDLTATNYEILWLCPWGYKKIACSTEHEIFPAH